MVMRENYKKIIDHYGTDTQKVKAIEELSELQKEIAKDLIGQGNIENVAEEIADAKVMIEQLQMIYEIENDDVEKITREKILRTCHRIDLESEERQWKNLEKKD